MWPGANCLLDCGTATMKLMGNNGNPAIVILGPDLEVIFTGGDVHKGSYYMQTAEKAPFNFDVLRGGYAPHRDKGLLGGVKVPADAKSVADLLRAGQIAAASQRLQSFGDKGETGDFKKEMTRRLEELRAAKRALFDKLAADGKKWDAYKVAASYLRVFPQAADKEEVNKKARALQSDPAVAKNIDARQVFFQVLPQLYGPTRNAQYAAQAKTTMQQFVDRYKDTECAALAAELAK